MPTPPPDSQHRPPSRPNQGERLIWLTGASLVACLLMIAGLLGVVLVKAAGVFWPHPLTQADLIQGGRILGIHLQRETVRQPNPDPSQPPLLLARSQFKVGNRDLDNADFRWIDHPSLTNWTLPPHAIVLEREEYGDFYGFLKAVKHDGQTVTDPSQTWTAFVQQHQAARRLVRQYARLRQTDDLSARIKEAEFQIKRAELKFPPGPKRDKIISQARARIDAGQAEFEQLRRQLADLHEQKQRSLAIMETTDGTEVNIPLATIVRAYRPNHMSLGAKTAHYAAKAWEFVSGQPRESNTEGGIFPAIFGTVLMTLIMSVAVVPFGVLAAFYLREYAKQGPFVRAVRIAVNNLAGVPSIVFGVFGLGFFVYFLGGTLDQLFYPERLPNPTFGTGGILWASLTLALLTVPVVIVATEESIAAVPRGAKEGSLALGASKFQTMCRVVLPASVPGIMTGLILAIARGAGEVAPLMITGVVKLAPNLPLDSQAPFLHLERKFMHLGFHIYDVGFQSPNVEAAKPMVYTTALLLLLVVAALNLAAIFIRDRIRKKYRAGAFA